MVGSTALHSKFTTVNFIMFADMPIGILTPVDPVSRYRRPETLGHPPLRRRRRRAPQPYPTSKRPPNDHQVDEYA